MNPKPTMTAHLSAMPYEILETLFKYLDPDSLFSLLEADRANIGSRFAYTNDGFWRKFASERGYFVSSRSDLAGGCRLRQKISHQALSEDEQCSTKGFFIKLSDVRELRIHITYILMK